MSSKQHAFAETASAWGTPKPNCNHRSGHVEIAWYPNFNPKCEVRPRKAAVSLKQPAFRSVVKPRVDPKPTGSSTNKTIRGPRTQAGQGAP